VSKTPPGMRRFFASFAPLRLCARKRFLERGRLERGCSIEI